MPSIRYFFTAFLFILLPMAGNSQEIKWMSWEEAAEANAKIPKKFFVDIYTDWCGWCKKMDVTTFIDPVIIERLNKDFYAIKLNAEQKEKIVWEGKEFQWMPGGRGGYHQLAFDLVEGKLSYPTYVILDSQYRRILIAPGYKTGEVLIKKLLFASEDHYLHTTWQDFKSKS